MRNEVFTQVLANFTGAKTTEELVYAYRNGAANEVIAHIYTSNYRQFNAVSDKFRGIDDATKESVIMEEIWKALEDYQVGSSCQITSLICTYIKNSLRALTQANKMDKRVLNECTHSQNMTDYLAAGEGESEDKIAGLGTTGIQDIDELETRLYIESLDLNTNQKKFCNALLRGCKPTKSAVAASIGISRAGANVVVKALQTKCIDLVAR